MRTLILVRHSESKIDPLLPPRDWSLTREGRQRCLLLASKIEIFDPKLIVTSEEKKALETGKILAEVLNINCTTVLGLHEHVRKGGEILDQGIWSEMISQLFKKPSQLVFGLESGNQVKERFSEAICSVMKKNPEQNIAVITHGTVMSLYYQDLTGLDPYVFWCQLGLPAFYTVSWPECKVLSVEMAISNTIEAPNYH